MSRPMAGSVQTGPTGAYGRVRGTRRRDTPHVRGGDQRVGLLPTAKRFSPRDLMLTKPAARPSDLT